MSLKYDYIRLIKNKKYEKRKIKQEALSKVYKDTKEMILGSMDQLIG